MNLKEKTIIIDNKNYSYSKIVMLPTNDTVGLGNIFKMIDINILYDNNKDFIGKLVLNTNPLVTKSNNIFEAQHLYFLSTDKICEGDWFYDSESNTIHKSYGILNGLILFNNNSPSGYNPSFCFKVIASTNNFLNLSRPSNLFLEAYVNANNKNEKIEECLVEYVYKFEPISKSNQQLVDGITKLYWLPEGVCSEHTYYKNGEVGCMIEKGRADEYSFKIPILKTTKGEITIRKVKDSWSREEVSKAIHDCMISANSTEIGRLQKFIDKWIEENL